MQDVVFEPARVRRILVLSWGLIGDVFIRVPVIEAVRRRFPESHITVVVDPPAAQVLNNHPQIDEVCVFSRKKRPRGEFLREFIRKTRELRKGRYDLTINLYSGGQSPLVTRLVGSRYRLGFNHTRALRWANNLSRPNPKFCDNWTKDFATVLAPIGIDVEAVRRGTSFFVSPAGKAYADRVLAGRGGPLIAVNLGAGAADKRWPVERFVAVARQIHAAYGLVPVVFTNPGMEELASEFERGFGAEALRLPLASLDEVGGIMERCDFVLTGDTSLMHMAFGLKRPTLALFTYTRPQTVTPEDCPHEVCFLPQSPERDLCGNPQGIMDIPVGLVFDRFSALHARVSAAASSED